jgi:hypothetical protein
VVAQVTNDWNFAVGMIPNTGPVREWKIGLHVQDLTYEPNLVFFFMSQNGIFTPSALAGRHVCCEVKMYAALYVAGGRLASPEVKQKSAKFYGIRTC